MSSRLARDAEGHLVAEGTCPELHGLRWLVIGDSVQAAGVKIYFMCDDTRRASRPATGREQLESQRHAPYRPALSRQEREQQHPDDELAEQAAIELARREQQRRPVDLIQRAAA
jgi:hypothetical protein